jgi:phosphocarrier protein HPr
MSTDTAVSQTAIVGSRVGLHARPVALIAKKAASLTATVKIGKGEKGPVDARSALMLMTLGAACGDEVLVQASGEGASEALAEIVALVEADLDKEE